MQTNNNQSQSEDSHKLSKEMADPPIKRPNRSLNFGVKNRTAMGEFIPTNDGHQLSHLAFPTPGPLNYDPKLPPSGYHYSILGKNENQKNVVLSPGPTKYDIRDAKSVFERPPVWTLGKKLNPIFDKSDRPSPAKYQNLDRDFGADAIHCTMSVKHYTKSIIQPGPEKYYPKSTMGDAPKYSFGHRPITLEEATPGPLDYKLLKMKADEPRAPSFKIGLKAKDSFYTVNDFPSAASYYPKLESSGKTVTLKGAKNDQKILVGPGPANYIIPSMSDAPKCTLRSRNVTEYIDMNPGPGTYNPVLTQTSDSTPKFSLGRKIEHIKKLDSNPGPGSYSPIIGQVKSKVSLKGRYKAKVDITPGPSDYYNPQIGLSGAELARSLKKKSYSERLKTIIEDSPGPSDYGIAQNNTNKGPSYSLRKRLDDIKVQNTPAPNLYNSIPKNGSGPKATMKSRFSPFVLVFPSARLNTIKVKS